VSDRRRRVETLCEGAYTRARLLGSNLNEGTYFIPSDLSGFDFDIFKSILMKEAAGKNNSELQKTMTQLYPLSSACGCRAHSGGRVIALADDRTKITMAVRISRHRQSLATMGSFARLGAPPVRAGTVAVSALNDTSHFARLLAHLDERVSCVASRSRPSLRRPPTHASSAHSVHPSARLTRPPGYVLTYVASFANINPPFVCFHVAWLHSHLAREKKTRHGRLAHLRSPVRVEISAMAGRRGGGACDADHLLVVGDGEQRQRV
jgi:hypothetical protein